MSNSYLDRGTAFKIKKVLRYVTLFGLPMTLSKVRAQLHMQRSALFDGEIWRNQKCSKPDHPGRMIAIVGCGNYAYSVIAFYLKKRAQNFLRATYDVDRARARSLCEDFSGLYATSDFETIIADPAVKLVYIASNHASHAEYAIKCIEAGKNVHIEKPHVVTEEQLERLLEAHKKHPDVHIYLGFNRPRSPHFSWISDLLGRETGPTMINWFIAGHEIPDDHWYFKDAEGGRVLGNLCHWTTLTLDLVGLENAFPCAVIPACNPETRTDYCLGLKFNDGSVAGITFSLKGHTFEGVREILQAHRGNALVSIRDFRKSTAEIIEKKKRKRSLLRNHGHRKNIITSFEGTLADDYSHAVNTNYIEATARLFLGVKNAIESSLEVTVNVEALDKPQLVAQPAKQSIR